MEKMELIRNFYQHKKIFITGNTGFKGAWLCRMLLLMGAEITGYALESPTDPALFSLLGLSQQIHQITADIRDLETLQTAVQNAKPEIVFHLAAQPLVREGYLHPVETYSTNIMGTVNLLESVRQCDSVQSVINVTTDKVYQNAEWCYPYRETDKLGGNDPYSSSKSCSELVTASYCKSFLNPQGKTISTCRAGNVIGGGDFSKDRIIPDCVRAVQKKQAVFLRNPRSVRPYQHVLEPLTAYLLIAMQQYQNPELAGNYNIAPEETGCITTENLTALFGAYWGENFSYEINPQSATMPEAGLLKLDSSLIRQKFGFQNCWNIRQTVQYTVEWYQAYLAGCEIQSLTDSQIALYENAFNDSESCKN